MRRRKHGSKRTGLTKVTILLALVAVLIALFAGASYAGYRYERARAARILPGVRIAGIDVSDMTRPQAEQAIAGRVRSILSHSRWLHTALETYRVDDAARRRKDENNYDEVKSFSSNS